MANIDHHPSRLDVEGFEIVDVLDPHRNKVFRAHRSASPDETLVVKLLKSEFEPILPGRRRAGSRRLIRAVQRSGGWVPLLESGISATGLDYIVQPYYPEGSLIDLLGQGGHWRSSLSLVGEAAAVVGQLGAQRLALGCLRPSYLLIDGDTVVVSFFGMSSRRFDDGTTQYLAPEQQGDTEPTPLCDVYTLGLILVELLVDRQREPQEPVCDLLASLPDSIPTDVVDLLDHATTSRLTNRIANAALLHRAITRLLADLPDDGIAVRETPGSDGTVADRVIIGDGTTAGEQNAETAPNPAGMTMGRLHEVDDQASTPPDSGPLDDLLEPAQARPAIRYHRPTAAPRSAAELELDTMVETLSGLPAADDDGGDEPWDDPDGSDGLRGPDDGGTEELGDGTEWAATERIGGKRSEPDRAGTEQKNTQPDLTSRSGSAPPVTAPWEPADADIDPEFDSVPFAPGTDITGSTVSTSIFKRATERLHLAWQTHRPTLATVLAVGTVAGIAGVAALLGATSLQSRQEAVSEGAPVSTTEAPAVVHINNAVPFLTEPPQTHTMVRTTAPARRRRVITTTSAAGPTGSATTRTSGPASSSGSVPTTGPGSSSGSVSTTGPVPSSGSAPTTGPEPTTTEDGGGESSTVATTPTTQLETTRPSTTIEAPTTTLNEDNERDKRPGRPPGRPDGD